MTKQEAIAKYNEYISVSKKIQYVLASVYYDDTTGAPKKAYQERSDVQQYFQMELFKRSISDEFKEIIANLDKFYDKLSPEYKRILDLEKKNLNQYSKVPEDVMMEYNKAQSDAFFYWEKAKNESDYSIYRPYLEKVVKAQLEMGKYIGEEGRTPYETFLDMYEEGITEKELDAFFFKLRSRIVPLLKRVMESGVKIDTEWTHVKVPHDAQMKMGIAMAEAIGYDFSRGMVRETEHPFTNTLSDNDVRVTTHIHETDFISNLFSMAHEGGHGVYEQNLNPKYKGTLLKEAASMSFHESQSRFFENIIGRSYEFSSYIFPKLKRMSKGRLKSATLEDYYLAINKAEPSLIRTEADELTYCLHVMIRYEIEKMMVKGDVDFDTLNLLWNQKYKEYLGIDVPSDKTGILQDMHWASGVGYFFSYALGNAYSAQIFHAMNKDIPALELAGKGKVKTIVKWLREHMYCYGCLLKPKDLLVKVTGEEFNADYYCDYLEEKFTKIYNLK